MKPLSDLRIEFIKAFNEIVIVICYCNRFWVFCISTSSTSKNIKKANGTARLVEGGNSFPKAGR